MTSSTLKRPSALIPLAMSLAALGLVLGHVALFGVAREADEGTAAHLWQLLMAGQIPIIALFALRWLPRTPRQALFVLVLQLVAGLAASSSTTSVVCSPRRGALRAPPLSPAPTKKCSSLNPALA